MHRHETGQAGPLRSVDLTQEYKTFVRGFLKPVRKLKVVVDASNGMAGKWFPILFADVDKLQAILLNPETTGEFVHDPNPLIDANLAQLQKEVRSQDADLGICFDGDADRCMFVDDKAQIVRCDLVTALLARVFLRQHPGSTIVYDLRSSRVVPEEIEAAGGVPRRERVGHAFMKKALADSKALFGGELSGHFYFRDNWYCDSGALVFICMLNVLTEQRKSLAKLIKPLQRYASSGERNFKNEDKEGTIHALAERYGDGRVDFLDGVTVDYDDWWFNVRPSNTEPLLRLNVEAKTNQLLQQKLKELTKQLGEPVTH
jgi:phosphomannomutase